MSVPIQLVSSGATVDDEVEVIATGRLRRVVLGVGLVFACALAFVSVASAQDPDPILFNNHVQIGVNPEGHLNAEDPAHGDRVVGLGYNRHDALSPGCYCEGWGVGDAISGESGWSGAVVGTHHVKVARYETDSAAGTAVSVTRIPNAGLRVIQHFSPKTRSLFVDKVRVVNASAAAVDARFRRTFDWDVYPTEFSEFVTIDSGDATGVLFTSDDGFARPDPLRGPSDIDFTGNAEDNGPDDHGGLFDFDLGTIAPGDSATIKLYWGATPDEASAKSVLGTIGAEAYSLGQSEDDPTTGTPNTFIFAATGVGGTPLCDAATATCEPIDTSGSPVAAAQAVAAAFDRYSGHKKPNPNERALKRASSKQGGNR